MCTIISEVRLKNNNFEVSIFATVVILMVITKSYSKVIFYHFQHTLYITTLFCNLVV